MQQFFAHTNFQEGESYLFYPCLQQRIDSDSSILFICILTNFYEVEMQFSQLGSCKYRCAYMNRVVGTSYLLHLHCRDFSLFFFSFLCAHKKHKKTQNVYKRTKIKKADKKHLRGKKSLVYLRFFCFCLFASLCFLCFLCFWCFWCVQNLFAKKREFKTALMTLFTLLLTLLALTEAQSNFTEIHHFVDNLVPSSEITSTEVELTTYKNL